MLHWGGVRGRVLYCLELAYTDRQWLLAYTLQKRRHVAVGGVERKVQFGKVFGWGQGREDPMKQLQVVGNRLFAATHKMNMIIMNTETKKVIVKRKLSSEGATLASFAACRGLLAILCKCPAFRLALYDWQLKLLEPNLLTAV